MRGDHETREAIRCVLNAGFERGQYAIRNSGQGANMQPKKYDTFCPKVIAGIGELDPTIASRCIPIRMQHANPGGYDDSFDKDEYRVTADKLRVRLAAWGAVKARTIRQTKPILPPQLKDRLADISKPLLAIADVAGGDWPQKAREALIVIFDDKSRTIESLRVTLLRHIKEEFYEDQENPHHFVSTADLILLLTSREDWPLLEMPKNGKPITGPGIARLLKPFGIAPVLSRALVTTTRGYALADLADAFRRYAS
jgi:Protein of unknown function (DUF3631)